MDKKEYKFCCEKCAFFTNAKSTYEIHLSTEKHKNGKKAIRCDRKYPGKCSKCNYKPKSNTNYLQHTLRYHSSKKERKEKFTYFCDKCDYGSFCKKSFETHQETEKHKLLCN